MPWALLLLLQWLRAVAPDDAFGRRQGVSTRLHEVPACKPPMLPTAAGRCNFNYESDMLYLPEPGLALAEASPAWAAASPQKWPCAKNAGGEDAESARVTPRRRLRRR